MRRCSSKVDKRRTNYYQYYTDRIWGRAENYDLCINTGKFAPEEVCGIRSSELIKNSGDPDMRHCLISFLFRN